MERREGIVIANREAMTALIERVRRRRKMKRRDGGEKKVQL